MGICSVEGCDLKIRAKGLCNKHYLRFVNHNSTDCIRPHTERKWTDAEIEFLKKKYPKKGAKYVAYKLDRTMQSVYRKARRMNIGSNRFYTQKQLDYIDNSKRSYRDMAKALNRSEDSIRYVVCRNGLSNIIISNDDSLCCAEIGRLVGRDNSTIDRSWVNKGLQFHRVGQYKMVYIKDLMEFMKNNTNLWDATKCEEWFFDDEDWFVEKLKEDSLKRRKERWGEFYEVV